MAMSASCKCGAIRINIDSMLGVGQCHCLNCRKTTSSIFSVNAAVPTSAFHLVSGAPKTIDNKNEDGVVTSTLNFCGDCGSALWVANSRLPDVRVLKAGILDGDDVFAQENMKPKLEAFTKRRAPWLCATVGAAQFDEMPNAKDVASKFPEAKSD